VSLNRLVNLNYPQKLDLSNNKITRGVLRQWAQSEVPVEADWGREEGHYTTEMAGFLALAGAITDHRTLVSLNLSANSLGAEAAAQIVCFLRLNVSCIGASQRSRFKILTLCYLPSSCSEHWSI
jgi:hypothetical protein